MFGRVMEYNPMRWITQKGRSHFHRLQNTIFAFDPQIDTHIGFVGDIADQRFGLVGIEIVGNEMPFANQRSPFQRELNMLKKSASFRVSPPETVAILPVATSKLTMKDNVPCRIYSNSRRST